MTISTTKNRINHTSDGVQTTFTFDFQIDNAAECFVWLNGDTDNPLSGYTITGLGEPAGGEIVFAPTPPAAGTLTIQRLIPFTQQVDYVEYDRFPAESHEGALDKLTKQNQQQQDELNRALVAGVTTPTGVKYTLPAPESNKVLQWNQAADGIENGPTTQEIEQAKTDSQAAATAAASSASAASGSASAAASSASAASASETKASQWADANRDVEVEPGKYSAKHWAEISQGNAIPIGAEFFFSGDTAPIGFLFADDGAAYSRTAYAALFAHYGVAYGAGDGSTTFNVPHARGRVIRVMDGGAGVDTGAASRTDRGDGTTGDTWGTNQEDQTNSVNGANGGSGTTSAPTLSAIPEDGTSSDFVTLAGVGPSAFNRIRFNKKGVETYMKNTARRVIVKAYNQ